MTTFLTRFGAFVRFVLAGFDRLRFRGESRRLNNARGLDSYLYQERIRYVEFRDHCQALTQRLREQSEGWPRSTVCRSAIGGPGLGVIGGRHEGKLLIRQGHKHNHFKA